MEDDWIFLGDGASGWSDTDSASDDGSDSHSGFTIVRRGRQGGVRCSVVVGDDAPALVAAVAVPQPTPPGLSFKVVSYAEAFSASSSASCSSEDGGGREQPAGCNGQATAGEAIIQCAGIDDDAAGTGSTDDCAVPCEEGCESDQQVGEHDGTGNSAEAPSAPPVAAAPAPTVNCPETTAPVLYGEAHSDSELASGMDQGGAEEVEDEDSESCEEDYDDDTENSIEDEDEDTDSSSDEEEEEEDEATFSSSDEEYTESFSEKEYTAEFYSEEEEDDYDDDDAESSGEEEEEDGLESCGEVDYVESSGEESHDADNTGEEEDDDSEVSGEKQEEEEDDAECSGVVDDVESTGEEEDDDDSEISGEEGEEEEVGDAECSGDEDDVDNSGDEPDDTVSSGEDSDDDAESSGEEEEEEDTMSSGETEESSHVVDVAENDGKKDIFAMLFPSPRATTVNAEQGTANANGAVKEQSESFPSKYDDMDTDSSGSDMDTQSSDVEDDDCLESNEEDDTVDIAENGNQDIFAMLFPKAKACGANIMDESEHGYIDYEAEEEDDDMDTDSSGTEDDCSESDGEDGIADVAENGNQDIFAMLFPKATACDANFDDYEDESEHGSIDYEEEEEDGSLFDMLLPRDCAIDDDINSSDGEDEAATATAACGYSAEPSHGTRRPEFAGRAARDDVDTDSDMEEGDDEVVAADVYGTSLHGWPRATIGGGVESHRWGFARQSQTERQALWEHLRRQLAAEAFESSGQQQQQRSYDDVDDTCDVPGTAAPGGGPAGSCACARTPEAQFTARAVRERDTKRELAMEEARRREAAQQELDRELAREAEAAAEALESAPEGCATAKRQATGVTRPAVAEPAVTADITFIIGLYVLVYLVVSLLSLGLS